MQCSQKAFGVLGVDFNERVDVECRNGRALEDGGHPADYDVLDAVGLKRLEWTVVGAVGAALTLVVLSGYERSLGTGPDVEHARAMALVTLVIASATLTATLSRLRTLTARTIAAASGPRQASILQLCADGRPKRERSGT